MGARNRVKIYSVLALFWFLKKKKGLIKWTFSTAYDNGKKLGEEINIMAQCMYLNLHSNLHHTPNKKSFSKQIRDGYRKFRSN